MFAAAIFALTMLYAPADWLRKWEKSIVESSRDRYCDKETGEELGWLISPFLSGYFYGYEATKDPQWIDRLVDWTDSLVSRKVKEPDGFEGWPKAADGGSVEESYFTDSLLGEAMAMKPVVLMSSEILRRTALKKIYGVKAKEYIALAERIFQKWDSRGCWRTCRDGGLWVVPEFGIDPKTNRWTSGYADREKNGFSNPANKENAIAEWMLAMYDATKRPVYRDRAAAWFRLMKGRIRTEEGGKYDVWDYWDPSGPWDYKPDGSTKHWVGVHPNGGYYQIDVDAIVDAYSHGLVFDRADIDRLTATNRDFMWNHQVEDAKFKRIDGGDPDPRWKNSPGVLWSALIVYDPTLRKVFEANCDPSSWGGLAATPWYLSTATSG